MAQKQMTANERLTRIFENKEVDRPSFKMWGYYPGQGLLHPAYAPVIKLAGELTDVLGGSSSPFSIYSGIYGNENASWHREKTDDPLWDVGVSVFHTKRGDLIQKDLISNTGEPGYTLEHAVKCAEDLEAFMQMPYKPFDFSADAYFNEIRSLGDKGLATFGLDHAGYAVQRITGSETLAIMSVEDSEIIESAIALYASRILEFAKTAIDNGIKGVYSWVGPELLTPPLLGHKDFQDFCVKYDKPICDAVHNAGGHIWVHCHGKVAKLLDDFIYMGVDVLNPIEPPKNGDVDMNEVVSKYGNRIGLEGNIEIQDILQAEPEVLLSLIEECVAAGKKSGRFVLCPSAGFMEYTHPDEKYINNLLLYLNEGYRLVCN